ncbi:hypothetical protein Hsar01_03162 [Haloferula sargassicola]|uniref:Uncharacterized protein n=1 Tax=Haloferula sargassicola TaxID=490096 RepID=A0ABP9URQ1_9BACT
MGAPLFQGSVAFGSGSYTDCTFHVGNENDSIPVSPGMCSFDDHTDDLICLVCRDDDFQSAAPDKALRGFGAFRVTHAANITYSDGRRILELLQGIHDFIDKIVAYDCFDLLHGRAGLILAAVLR